MAVIQTQDDALRAVAQRIADRKQEIARQIVDRFREEVVGFQLGDESETAGVMELVLLNIDALLGDLERGDPIPEELLEMARDMAARQSHRGVSLDSLMHAGRLWGEVVWEAVIAVARPDSPGEREAALWIAGRLWRHVDVMSTAKAHAYLDEITDRSLLGRDLMDALLAGHGDDEEVRRLAGTVHLHLSENYVVVVARADGVPAEDAGEGPLAARVALDRLVEAARRTLRPSLGSLLIGIRHGDLVVLYPVSRPEDVNVVRRDCDTLAGAVAVDVSVGVSGWHRGPASLAAAYAEAREAADIAAGAGIRGRAVILDDLLVDLMLRGSPHARRILEDTLRPLVEYDREHQATLLQTLRAYLRSGMNLTESGRHLVVHPNTVVYRLRRIRELSGRDPREMDDLQVLFLALKLDELSSSP